MKAVNSSCNLGKADTPLPAPRSRTRTPPAPPAEIRFHRLHGLAKALRSGIRLVESFLTGLSFPAELPAIDCRPTADMADAGRPTTRQGAAIPPPQTRPTT